MAVRLAAHRDEHGRLQPPLRRGQLAHGVRVGVEHDGARLGGILEVCEGGGGGWVVCWTSGRRFAVGEGLLGVQRQLLRGTRFALALARSGRRKEMDGPGRAWRICPTARPTVLTRAASPSAAALTRAPIPSAAKPPPPGECACAARRCQRSVRRAAIHSAAKPPLPRVCVFVGAAAASVRRCRRGRPLKGHQREPPGDVYSHQNSTSGTVGAYVMLSLPGRFSSAARSCSSDEEGEPAVAPVEEVAAADHAAAATRANAARMAAARCGVVRARRGGGETNFERARP